MKGLLYSTQHNIQKCGMIMDSLRSRLVLLCLMILITNSISIESKPLSNVCLTPTCVQAAADILKKMDSSVDPCDDFYKFTCGQFLNSTFVSPNADPISWVSDMKDDTENKLGLILNSEITKNEIKPFQQAKQFYRQCMNRTNLLEQQDEIILDILSKLGGWPVIEGEKWNSTNIDWIKLPAMGLKAGYFRTLHSFLPLTFEISDKNSTEFSIKLSPTHNLRLRQNISFNDPKNIEFYNSLVNYAVRLGAEEERAKQELMDSIKFEIELTNISSSVNDEMGKNESSLDNFMTIDEMMKKWPTIDWLSYINEIFSVSSDIKKADKNESIIINCPSYITKFTKLINSTPKRIIVNYALTQIVLESLEYIDFKNEIIFDGSQSRINSLSWAYCVIDTVKGLPQIITALYVRKYIEDKTRIEATNITLNIKKEFIKILNEVEWLDGQTRNNVIKKIQDMRNKIGYPDMYRSDENFTKAFEDLKLDERSYLHSLLKINQFNTIKNLRYIRNKVELDNIRYWHVKLMPGAFYFSNNVLSISPLLLQRPFIDVEQPAYINYGRIGMIFGHELTHAIDNTFREFDDEGKKGNWWSKSSEQDLKKKIDCFANQYDNYTVEEVNMKINGTLTQNENFDDNVGTRLSYFAYKNWSLRYGPEPKLPALDYNPLQMFWISMASLWCSKMNNEYFTRYIKSDVHSLSQYRILGTLSNIPEFSEDFKCPLGSPMNPEIKCTIW